MTALQREKVVRYACPHCRAGLEWRVGLWRGWVSCPACGRPGLPPAPRLVMPDVVAPTREVGAGLRAEQWIASGDVPDASWPMWSRGQAPIQPRVKSESKALPSALAVGLAISLFLLLIGYLDQSTNLAGVAALVALLCLWGRMKFAKGR